MNPIAKLFKRVGVKLIVSFIVVAAVPVLVVGFYSGQISTDTIIKSAIDGQVNQVTNIKHKIISELANIRSATLFLAHSTPMTNYLTAVHSKQEASVVENVKKSLQQDMIQFAASHDQLYSQVRYINEYGREIIRVELKGDTHLVAPTTDLQNVSKTEYFKASSKLRDGKVYVSRLSLNRDGGLIEVPHRPVIRYATPVFYPNGSHAGIVVSNLQASGFLDKLGNNQLVNDEGFYLYHPDAEKRWGSPRDLDNKINYKTQRPEEWQEISSKPQGSIYQSGADTVTSFASIRIPGSIETWTLIAEDMQSVVLAPVNSFQSVFYTILGATLLGTMIIAFWSSRAITRPLLKLTSAIKRVAAGDEQARARISSRDEFEELGNAFDNMVEERIATLHRAEKENEALNDSIIELMEATSKLSENDLSIKVPVREDVTGVVADGLNKMVVETAKILNGINQVSHEVQQAAETVKKQSDRVTEVANEERKVVEETLRSLNESAKTMTEVADVAQSCNDLADRASKSTEKALATVNNTVEGMNDIRETISETEKRIKRLGERSQEITSVVEIINNIAERTHVLALNASMQAAAAGEAGRGFAVVADEVQRLAENSRDSTSQIAALVHSIQTETSETMATMNKSISQVVAGSELAEQAGLQMQETQTNTKELVAAVEKIAERSAEQAMFSEILRQNAAGIQQSTEVTGQELREQSEHTINLVEYAKRLKDSVEVFKLPQAS